MEFINKIYLSYASLQYAINICQEKEGYKVVIAIDDEESYKEAKDFLSTLAKDCDNIEQFADCKHESNFHIYFKNGSLIRFINTSGNVKGQRYHLLISDKNVSEDVMRCIVLPLGNREWIDKF